MVEETLPEHSPMGGSKAECIINCPGSVPLGKGLPNPDSEFSAEGTLAHEIAAECLEHEVDAWTRIDEEKGITKEMADAIQVYLDDVRSHKFKKEESFIEHKFAVPGLHKHYRGILDFAAVKQSDTSTLHLWDYKHGVGIQVEVVDNSQLKYYGTGMIFDLKENYDISIDKVIFTIAQPRGFHSDGPIRSVEYTREELFTWAQDTMIPAMVRAETDTTTVAGEWCRFCPVRFRDCPALRKDMKALSIKTQIQDEGDLSKIEHLSDERIGEYLKLAEKVNIVKKAMETLAFQRLRAGKNIPGKKLIVASGNRQWREGAEAKLKEKFKNQAYKPGALLSPAQIDKLPEGKSLTAELAFKPAKGLTMVNADHKSPAVNTDTKSLFKPIKETV